MRRSEGSEGSFTSLLHPRNWPLYTELSVLQNFAAWGAAGGAPRVERLPMKSEGSRKRRGDKKFTGI